MTPMEQEWQEQYETPTLAVAQQHGTDEAMHMIQGMFDERARELEADWLAARCSFEAALQARGGN